MDETAELTEGLTGNSVQPGKIVRELRLSQKMTQEELAKKARLPLIAVMRIERNGLGCCARHYVMVAQALNVPVCRFFMAENLWEQVTDIF